MSTRFLASMILGLSAAAAQAAIFGFEEFAPGPRNSLTSTQGGLTLSVQRGPMLPMQVLATTPYPASWGRNAIAPYGTSSSDPFFFNFSAPISAFQMETGDYGADQDFVQLDIYSGLNGTGSHLGMVTATYPITATLPDDVITLALNAPAGQTILSATIIQPGFGQSMIIDNLVATPAPEPASLASLSLLGLIATRRRA